MTLERVLRTERNRLLRIFLDCEMSDEDRASCKKQLESINTRLSIESVRDKKEKQKRSF